MSCFGCPEEADHSCKPQPDLAVCDLTYVATGRSESAWFDGQDVASKEAGTSAKWKLQGFQLQGTWIVDCSAVGS